MLANACTHSKRTLHGTWVGASQPAGTVSSAWTSPECLTAEREHIGKADCWVERPSEPEAGRFTTCPQWLRTTHSWAGMRRPALVQTLDWLANSLLHALPESRHEGHSTRPAPLLARRQRAPLRFPSTAGGSRGSAEPPCRHFAGDCQPAASPRDRRTGPLLGPGQARAVAVSHTREVGSLVFPHITQSCTPNGSNPFSRLDAPETRSNHALAFDRSSQALEFPASPRTSRWHGPAIRSSLTSCDSCVGELSSDRNAERAIASRTDSSAGRVPVRRTSARESRGS